MTNVLLAAHLYSHANRTLGGLPQELSDMAFNELGDDYFSFNKNGELPALLVAYRGRDDPTAYDRILRRFEMVNAADNNGYIMVALDDLEALSDWGPAEAAAIEGIPITSPLGDGEDRLCNDLEFRKAFVDQFADFTQVTKVRFQPIYGMDNYPDALALITEFPSWLVGFPHLKELSVEIASLDAFDKKLERSLRVKPFEGIQKQVGVKGRQILGSGIEKDFGHVRGFASFDSDEILSYDRLNGDL